MKNSITWFIGAVIVVLLLAYMFAFQVRYDEAVVLTTFDKAEPPQLADDGTIARSADGEPVAPGSVIVEPGLYFRWPWPVQKVYPYTTRVQILDDRLVQLQAADGKSYIVETYLAWRIVNPQAFYINLKDKETAESKLLPIMGDTKGVFSKYSFDELVNTDASKLKFKEIEQELADHMSKRVAAMGYGVKIEQVGIRRILLPEDVTAKVFESMKATRQRMAAETRASGEAVASSIRSEANTARDRIMAQAQRRAQSLRARGVEEAAAQYAIFAQNEELAKFLARVQSLGQFLPHRSTIIVPSDEWGLDKLFSSDGVTDRPTPLAPPAPVAPPTPAP